MTDKVKEEILRGLHMGALVIYIGNNDHFYNMRGIKRRDGCIKLADKPAYMLVCYRQCEMQVEYKDLSCDMIIKATQVTKKIKQ